MTFYELVGEIPSAPDPAVKRKTRPSILCGGIMTRYKTASLTAEVFHPAVYKSRSKVPG